MNKIIKASVTVLVFLLVFLYFRSIYLSDNNKPIIKPDNPIIIDEGSSNNPVVIDDKTAKDNFNALLNSRIRQYFSSRLPKNDGEIVKVSISDLIKSGLITTDDLKYVGSSCSGDAYVTKANNSYYYYDNIICGIYSSDEYYANWSDWVDTLPNLSGKNYQIMVRLLYRYDIPSGNSTSTSYTSWSDWAESESQVKKPSVPSGATILDTEKENKTQYRSRTRTATYKWYKLSSGTTYYNNGAYYESSPASGYTKDYNTKVYSRETAEYSTIALLKSKEPNVTDSDIKTVSKYEVGEESYKYSYTTPSSTTTTNQCISYGTKYKYMCYKYNSSTQTYSKADVSTSSSTALQACQNNAGQFASTCTTYISTPATSGTENCTGATYKYSAYFMAYYTVGNSAFNGNCRVACDKMPSGYEAESIDTVIDCLYSYSKYGGTTHTCTNLTDGSTYKLFSTYNGAGTTGAWLKQITKWHSATLTRVSGSCSTTGGSPAKYGYRYTATTYTKTYKSGYYDTCSGEYPNIDTTQYTTEQVCTQYATTTVPGTTYYLKSNGSVTTNVNEAAQLTQSQYNSLVSKNSSLANYTRVSETRFVTFTGTYKNGTCPAGTNSANCHTITTYKATVYKYKWYKSSSTTKTWCNNGSYSASSPASGCIKDESTIKYSNWSSWSGYSDTKVDKTDLREVETRSMVRLRYRYSATSSTGGSTGWLTKEELEKKTGKKLSELSGYETKVSYKYRVKN